MITYARQQSIGFAWVALMASTAAIRPWRALDAQGEVFVGEVHMINGFI
ncbi:MAG: hypothetical protein IPL59_13665 [Candidatus Competibacteraceae bacterium]|nr:hypothetical protein [Candidatus Competibacteraceae bacterium]